MAVGEVFLFLGPELGEKRDAIERMRGDLNKKYGVPPEETSFYVCETPSSEITAFILTGSLFSAARLVFVKNADALKKDDAKNIVLCLKKPAPDTVLILISDETALDRVIENAVPKEAKRVFWELFENKKPEWVRSYFRREGLSVDDDAVNAILELVENNTDALRRECSHLVLFAGEKNGQRNAISADFVEKWLAHTRSESAFTLFSALASGNLSNSAAILETLLASQESPVAILAGLTWCFRRFRDYCGLASRGITNDFELKKIGIGTAKGRRDYSAAGRTFGLDAADRCIALCAEYDLAVRMGGSGSENILLDLFLYKLLDVKRQG
jgi:DNA polymerase-3 subunit delta